MKSTLYYLFILALSIIGGLFIAHLPAFILVQVGAFSVAMPLWVLFSGLLLCIYLYCLLRRWFTRVLMIPKKWRDNLKVMQQRQAMRQKIQEIEAGIKHIQGKS